MKVILLQDVAKIGKAGTVKEVKVGYVFNYLLPQGKASLATPAALRTLERQLAQEAARLSRSAEESQKKATALSGKTLTLKRPAENGKLFGGVTKVDLARELAAGGFAVLPSEIILEKTIKKTGVFPLRADFGGGVGVQFEIDIQAE